MKLHVTIFYDPSHDRWNWKVTRPDRLKGYEITEASGLSIWRWRALSQVRKTVLNVRDREARRQKFSSKEIDTEIEL